MMTRHCLTGDQSMNNLNEHVEAGKKELSWDQYLALLFVFQYNEKTSSVVDVLGLYPEQVKDRIRKGIVGYHG